MVLFYILIQSDTMKRQYFKTNPKGMFMSKFVRVEALKNMERLEGTAPMVINVSNIEFLKPTQYDKIVVIQFCSGEKIGVVGDLESLEYLCSE